MPKLFKRKQALIIEWRHLPDAIKENIKENWLGFHNDCLLPVRSEFSPFERETWETAWSQKRLEKYHHDQVEFNKYKGDLDAFIKDYGLEFDVYMIEQGLDLKGIDAIYVNVSW